MSARFVHLVSVVRRSHAHFLAAHIVCGYHRRPSQGYTHRHQNELKFDRILVIVVFLLLLLYSARFINRSFTCHIFNAFLCMRIEPKPIANPVQVRRRKHTPGLVSCAKFDKIDDDHDVCAQHWCVQSRAGREISPHMQFPWHVLRLCWSIGLTTSVCVHWQRHRRDVLPA